MSWEESWEQRRRQRNMREREARSRRCADGYDRLPLGSESSKPLGPVCGCQRDFLTVPLEEAHECRNPVAT